MARAQGSRAQMALGFESVYGTPPAANTFWQMPFVQSTLGAEQPLPASDLLGYGRDPLAPIRDAITAEGDVTLPIDARFWGVWLKAAFGSPATAGVVAATGSIVFAAQPATGSTITINGTAFSFVASGATGNQITIGANLAATLSNMVTALNASVVAGVALATYGQTGGTTLTVLFDVTGPAGNSFTLAAGAAPASNGTASGATLTGGANSHTFQSGGWSLPSFSTEIFLPEVPHAGMNRGCVVNQLAWSMAPSGLVTAAAGIIAQTETVGTTSAAGTLNSFPFTRFAAAQGALLRGGATLGNVVGAQITYANNLDRIEVIRGDGLIEGADPSRAALSGTIDVRFADQTLLTQAVTGGPTEFQFLYQIDASIAALEGRGGALRQMGDNSSFAAFQSRNLLFQVNDIGVSLAGGMSPMTVLVQQGGQIAQMYAGQGGVNAALRQTAGLIGGVVSRFPLLTAAIALGGAAIAGMTHEINAMGGTTVSFGDTALAVWQAVGDGLRSILKPAVDAVAPWFSAAWDAVVAGVKLAGNGIINGFRAAFVTVSAVWSGLPAMIGEAVYATANAVVAGTEAMINGVIDRINRFVAGLNEALSALPAWATGGTALRIGTLGNVTLGRVGNPYAGTAEDSASRVRGQISAIMADDPLGGLFDSIRQRATANAAARAAAEDKAGVAAGRAGKAAKQASEEAANARDAELTGIDAITAALARYGTEAANIGKGIGEALAGGFGAAEEAVGRFVRTGKLDFRELVSSLLADMARLSVRKAILGPIAERLSGWLGGAASGGGFLATWLGGGTAAASVLHAGGRVGTGPMRTVPVAAFLHAPRFHNGGGFGLRPDEQAAILQRGERVLNRRETRDWEAGGGTRIVITARDAQSFRQSRAQVAADIARAVAFGRRSS